MGMSGFNLYRRRLVEKQVEGEKKERDQFKVEVADSGVGEAVADRLWDAGFRSREELAGAFPVELQEIEGIGEARAQQLLSWAKGGPAEEEKTAEEPEEPQEQATLRAPENREEPNWEAMTVAELEEYGKKNFEGLELSGLKQEKIKTLHREWKKANKES